VIVLSCNVVVDGGITDIVIENFDLPYKDTLGVHWWDTCDELLLVFNHSTQALVPTHQPSSNRFYPRV
jgi:hypothetical protein